jgi:hypothetical protein
MASCISASVKGFIKPHKLSCAGKVYWITFMLDIFSHSSKQIKLTCNMEFLGKRFTINYSDYMLRHACTMYMYPTGCMWLFVQLVMTVENNIVLIKFIFKI